jgi:hypothetical protein
VDLIHLAQKMDQWLAFMHTVINIGLPLKAEILLTRCVAISFSRRTLIHGVSDTNVLTKPYSS